MRWLGPYPDLVGKRFQLACRTLGLVEGHPRDRILDVSIFGRISGGESN
jgi:hypothetical protein